MEKREMQEKQHTIFLFLVIVMWLVLIMQHNFLGKQKNDDSEKYPASIASWRNSAVEQRNACFNCGHCFSLLCDCVGFRMADSLHGKDMHLGVPNKTTVF